LPGVFAVTLSQAVGPVDVVFRISISFSLEITEVVV
jgi:hypothetical protein